MIDMKEILYIPSGEILYFLNRSAGNGIRESNSKITDNKSRFVPHCIV